MVFVAQYTEVQVIFLVEECACQPENMTSHKHMEGYMWQ